MTAIKQRHIQRNEYRMTTTMMKNEGLPRFTDEEYEATFASSEGGTPRPGMDATDAAERRDAAIQAIVSFSQVAKQAAAANKRRRSPKARTDYNTMNKHVNRAFNELEAQMKQNEGMMLTEDDFKLLKQAIGNLRVKLIVHDNLSFHELEELQKKTKQEETAAEKAMDVAFMDTTTPGQQKLFEAKDKYHDLKAWSQELSKEISRVDLRRNYMRLAKGEQALQVPSQHAHLARASGVQLRNILSPETIRRTFISLETLTKKIRDEFVMFLIGTNRHKDRLEVIKQIKESCLAAAAAKKTNKAQ